MRDDSGCSKVGNTSISNTAIIATHSGRISTRSKGSSAFVFRAARLKASQFSQQFKSPQLIAIR